MYAHTAPTRSRFYVLMSLVFLAIAVLGFSSTFFIPLAQRTFYAPPIIYIHGFLLFGWLLLFIAQTVLIQKKSLTLHRQLGCLGALICLGIVVTSFPVGRYAIMRDVHAGNSAALGQFTNILIEMCVFGGFVLLAILLRRNPGTHKRLMLLSTISVLGPAWARMRFIFPSVPNPLFTFMLLADSLLFVAIAYDLLKIQRIHPAYIWGGGAMLTIHAIEFFGGAGPTWAAIARFLLSGDLT